MNIILSKICVLTTTALILMLVPGFRRSARSLLSVRDRWTALLVFLVLGLVEHAAVGRSCWYNHRIVVVCAAGLLAGPGIGIVVAGCGTGIAVAFDGRPLLTCGPAMFCGAFSGAWLYQRRPRLAQRPITGFCLTAVVSWLRDALVLSVEPNVLGSTRVFALLCIAPVLQGLGTALILAIVGLVREHDERIAEAAAAEVRALQSRMNPHFLFNALNAVAALANVAPRDVPRAAGKLGYFLRAMFDQQDRALVPLQEELAVVRAYLEIEALRMGSRLKIQETVAPGLAGVLLPPFSFQPVVENAVQHGVQSTPESGQLHLLVRQVEKWLELSVTDDGRGMAPSQIERSFFAVGPNLHALSLLRRRLRGLYGQSFRLEVESEVGQGTTVKIRIPLLRSFDPLLDLDDYALFGRSRL